MSAVANPKHAAGMKKPPVHCTPPIAELWLGYVHACGAAKYGGMNWGEAGVVATVYVDAIRRHLAAWQTGQDRDPETGAPHLAHIMACCAILIDCQALGNLEDDRPKGRTAAASGVLDEIAELMPRVRELAEKAAR